VKRETDINMLAVENVKLKKSIGYHEANQDDLKHKLTQAAIENERLKSNQKPEEKVEDDQSNAKLLQVISILE